MQLIDGKTISEQIKQEIAAEVAEIVANGGKRPHLAAILVGHDGGSETYVAHKVKACEQCGFKSTLIRHEDDITEEELLKEVAKAAKAEPAKLLQKVTSLQEELKALQSENEKLKAKLANDAVGDVDSKIQEVKGMKVLAMDVPDVDMNGLRNLGDQMKEKIGDGVVVLASANGGKVTLLAMATDAAIKKGAHAGNLIKEIASLVGGGGGGRPNMAQAGGKNPAGIPDALAKVVSVVESQLA